LSERTLKAEPGLVGKSPVRVWNLIGLARWSGAAFRWAYVKFVKEAIAHRRGR